LVCNESNIVVTYTVFDGEFATRWMALFGTTHVVCAIIWRKIDPMNTFQEVADGKEYGPKTHSCAKPIHLLWALMFLKVYGTERVSRTIVGSSTTPTREKTMRKWVRLFVRAISFLESEVVSYGALL